MSVFLSMVQAPLVGAGFDVAMTDDRDGPVLLFENDSVLGFVLGFPDAATLLELWQPTSQRVLQSAQGALRSADRKAWNAYLVLLAEAPGDIGQSVMLGAIEENLVGTRKIARAGIMDERCVRAALLPLLAIQNAPRLEGVDMAAEIRGRTTELPKELVDAFLQGVDEHTLMQLLETGQ